MASPFYAYLKVPYSTNILHCVKRRVPTKKEKNSKKKKKEETEAVPENPLRRKEMKIEPHVF